LKSDTIVHAGKVDQDAHPLRKRIGDKSAKDGWMDEEDKEVCDSVYWSATRRMIVRLPF